VKPGKPADNAVGAPIPASRTALWVILGLAACVGFVLLGNWQVHRLHWKLELIHDVDTRVHAAPVPAPGPAQWPRIAAGHERYLHVRLTGTYLPVAQTLVHGTSARGYGFWVMTPLRTERGFIVWVNRGYIPASLPESPDFARIRPPSGQVQLAGLLRLSEPGGGFLRPNDPAHHRWYSRDVAAITRAQHLSAQDVAPYFVDAAARATGSWPLGGQTVIAFPNHHLGYAITWYLLAAGSLVGVFLIVRHARRS